MANFNLNKVILGGRITADPEIKQTTSGTSVLSFSVAVNRRFASKSADGSQPQADFINVTAWRQTAEFISRYFKKGNPILICGQLQTRSWSDPQGQKRYVTEVVADEVTFVSPAANGQAPAGQQGASYSPDAYGAQSFSNAGTASFEEIPNDSDLPF